MHSINWAARWGNLRSYAQNLPGYLDAPTWTAASCYVSDSFAPEIPLKFREDEALWEDALEQVEMADAYLFREVCKRKSRFTHGLVGIQPLTPPYASFQYRIIPRVAMLDFEECSNDSTVTLAPLIFWGTKILFKDDPLITFKVEGLTCRSLRRHLDFEGKDLRESPYHWICRLIQRHPVYVNEVR